jgi:imidazole glycerol phosphate synthase subunit HisF
MLQVRVIPSLLLQDGGLVKTENFKKPRYLGDPINIVKIFNKMEVDELIVIAPQDDHDEAQAFASRVGARLALVSGPSEIPSVLAQALEAV